MTHFKRLTALLLTVVLLTGLLPVSASAAKQTDFTFETSFVNPLYADIIPEDILLPKVQPRVQTYASRSYTSDIEVAAEALREGMKNRQESITVYVFDTELTQESFDALVSDIFFTSFEHTGEPTEGDYLKWQWGASTSKPCTLALTAAIISTSPTRSPTTPPPLKSRRLTAESKSF